MNDLHDKITATLAILREARQAGTQCKIRASEAKLDWLLQKLPACHTTDNHTQTR